MVSIAWIAFSSFVIFQLIASPKETAITDANKNFNLITRIQTDNDM